MSTRELGCGRTARVVVVVAIAAALLTTMIVASGCGSSGQLPAIAAPSATAKRINVRVVSDHDWGFRMAYPDGWVGTRYQDPTPGSKAGALEYLLAYADPHGAESGGTYLDSVQTAVYQLEKPVQPSELTPKLASEFALNVILKGMTTFSARDFRKVDVAGVPGWAIGYQFKVGGQIVDANSMLVMSGNRAYWMTTQSGAYSWQKIAVTLATCQRYFKLLSKQSRG